MPKLTIQMPYTHFLMRVPRRTKILTKMADNIRIVRDESDINYFRDTTILASFKGDGFIYLKGSLIRNAKMGDALSEFQAYDEDNERIAYSLAGVRLMEIDTVTGNLLLAESEQINMPDDALSTQVPEGISTDGNSISWSTGFDATTEKWNVIAKLEDDEGLTDLSARGVIINNAYAYL